MDASTSVETHHEPHEHDAAHEHHELGWWRKYIFSSDHKVIGIQYGITGLLFMFFGFSLMMGMRWQLAYPGKPIPVIGKALYFALNDKIVQPGGAQSQIKETMFSKETASGKEGVMTPAAYNAFGAMHGTIMVFLAIVP